jgi:hypothetical protein
MVAKWVVDWEFELEYCEDERRAEEKDWLMA